jgi:hypothetical protein
MGHVGRPESGLARGDPGPILADPDPATTLDDDEPGRIRVGVRFDARTAGERQLRDGTQGPGFDDLATHLGRARRPVRSAMADPEPADVDGHRTRPG